MQGPERLFELLDLVNAVMRHMHTFTCFKKHKFSRTGVPLCRFVFPRAVTHDQDGVTVTVREGDRLPSGDQLLDVTVEPPRAAGADENINPYTVLPLLAWRANMDQSLVANPFGAMVYVSKYITKAEEADITALAGDIVKQLRYIPADDPLPLKREIRTIMLSVLGHREVSAQEAAWYVLQFPFVLSTRQVERLTLVEPFRRFRRLRPAQDLAQLPDESTNVFEHEEQPAKGWVLFYQQRPTNDPARPNPYRSRRSTAAHNSDDDEDAMEVDLAVPASAEELHADVEHTGLPRAVAVAEGNAAAVAAHAADDATTAGNDVDHGASGTAASVAGDAGGAGGADGADGAEGADNGDATNTASRDGNAMHDDEDGDYARRDDDDEDDDDEEDEEHDDGDADEGEDASAENDAGVMSEGDDGFYSDATPELMDECWARGLDWRGMTLATFVTWFRVLPYDRKRERRTYRGRRCWTITLGRGERRHLQLRKRRAVLRVVPYVRGASFDDNAFCYRVLMLHFPFRDEKDVWALVEQHGGSAVQALRSVRRRLPVEVQRGLDMEQLVEAVSHHRPRLDDATRAVMGNAAAEGADAPQRAPRGVGGGEDDNGDADAPEQMRLLSMAAQALRDASGGLPPSGGGETPDHRGVPAAGIRTVTSQEHALSYRYMKQQVHRHQRRCADQRATEHMRGSEQETVVDRKSVV